MALRIYRLRRLLAGTAIVLSLAVAGIYFYARSRAPNVLKSFPGKIGLDIKQTANGFQYSNSKGGRTQFTVQAHDVKEFKVNGNAELHGVSIVLYGRDSTRFDRISGDDFSFNQKTGDVVARGEVEIDLLGNPEGGTAVDQAAPKEMKNPIHLKTRDLVFNKDSGNAATDARVDFRTPQATGWAVGVKYDGTTKLMTLMSQVHLILSTAHDAVLEAEHGVITNEPRQIELEHPRLTRADGVMQAEHATFYLTAENQVERVLATGNVTSETRSPGGSASGESASGESAQGKEVRGRSDRAEFVMASQQNQLRTATLTGSVHFEQEGEPPLQGDSGRAILDFGGHNELRKVHALDGARLYQKGASVFQPSAKGQAGTPQDFELKAPVIDFDVVGGHFLRHASTAGAAQITIADAQPAGSMPAASSLPSSSQARGQRTVVTAGKFDGDFATAAGKNHLAHVHGAPAARIVNSNPDQPDRVSTSEAVDADFLPLGGIEALTQTGHVAYTDNETPDKRTQAWSDNARYTPADQVLVMTGSPRVTSGSMATTAKMVRVNRATGESEAEGDVKSTYNEVKEQPDGALLASSSPIHVTAPKMTAHNEPGVALYTGNARLWQDANLIQAPSIEFDRDRRFLTAQGTAGQPVQTVLVQTEKAQTEKADASNAGGNSNSTKAQPVPASSPIAITSMKLTYADAERKAHYEGGVVAKGADFTATSNSADAYLLPRSQMTGKTQQGPGQLEKIVAVGNVIVKQPNRRADGEQLVYTAADDKFVLTGGPPSIFDAEQGKITGVSLTFFRHDDRVLVDGAASASVVTTTRVAQ
jgi:lipopolysaccharide export system protein LptA